MAQTINIKQGGKIGRVEIPPHSERVYCAAWAGNGTVIEVLLYSQPQSDADPSDRIHLLIHKDGQEKSGWLMNVEDANEIIIGLSIAIREAMMKGLPLNPQSV